VYVNFDGGAVKPEMEAAAINWIEVEEVFSYTEYFMDEEPALTAKIIGLAILSQLVLDDWSRGIYMMDDLSRKPTVICKI